MKPARWGVDAWVSSILLAGLTLTVFASLASYGPESAIRRFHLAAVSGDAADLQVVTAQPVDQPEVVALADFVRGIAQQNGSFQLGKVDRKSRIVVADVQYQIPGVRPVLTVWIVQKPPPETRWKVNAAETLAVMRRLGF